MYRFLKEKHDRLKDFRMCVLLITDGDWDGDLHNFRRLCQQQHR